ncbi:DNA-directed RNA polymerase subunit omega [Caloramator mitchellensis]|uniref:DNA-directed RNA polymerase subunit omega n=1 Tax=Caloramator mitchellensis TaxID=908809 RepID=A0A0R3JTR3_CALMK|nr:DNA-directed RNA polymerase subunit omega [Caloramator mitchellensis]KRQ86921.1 DNA-directed RNA polymerase subunit omega [Caloramator mitchellensis]
MNFAKESSMINPPILSLLEKIDNRYSLVVVTAKRARQLIGGAEPLVKIDSNQPVTIAVNEINNGKIKYHTVKAGIK